MDRKLTYHSTWAPSDTSYSRTAKSAKDKEQFAREHLQLAQTIASVIHSRLPGEILKEDVVSFAMEGLADAIDRFDPHRGVGFKTYATYRIAGAIHDGLVEADWLTRRTRRSVKDALKLPHLLRPANRRQKCRQKTNVLREIPTTYTIVLCAEMAEPEPEGPPPAVEAQIDAKTHAVHIKYYIETLPEKQKQVFKMHFYQHQTMESIAQELGLTKSWVSRLFSSASSALRAMIDNS